MTDDAAGRPDASTESKATGFLSGFHARTEFLLVYLLILATALGAFALWSARRYESTAHGLRTDIEITAALDAVEEATRAQMVSYDLRLLPRYAAAVHARELTMGHGDSEEAGLHDAERRLLAAYFSLGTPTVASLLDPSLGVYNSDYVLDRQRALAFERLPKRIEALQGDIVDAEAARARLLVATVLFAFGLICATLIDLSKSATWAGAWKLIAIGSLAAGAVLLVIDAWQYLWVVLVAGGALLLLRVALLATVGSVGGHDVSWWAELLRVTTVVLLTVAVVPLATANTSRADAITDGRRHSAEAARQLASGQQDALDDLDAAILTDSLRMRWTALAFTTEPTGPDGFAVVDGVFDVLVRGMTTNDGGHPRGLIAEDLIDDMMVNPYSFVADHLTRGSESALESFYLADRARADAADWGARASGITLALVVFGLAVYMFSLAANARHRAISSWVLAAGLLGLAMGIQLAASSWGAPDAAGDRDEAAASYAAGLVALRTGDCADAITHFDAAIDHYPIERVYLGRAEARLCDQTRGVMVQSYRPPDQITAFLDDLDASGSSQGWVLGARGSANALLGFDAFGTGDGTAHLHTARRLNEQALDRDPGNPYLLLIRAAVELGLGANEAADSFYERAFQCILNHDGDAGPCAGPPRHDPAVAGLFAINALADLELVEASTGELRTEVKERIVSELLWPGSAPGQSAALTLGPLTTHTHDFGVEVSNPPSANISMVWYHQPGDGQPWAVLTVPTLSTLTESAFGERVHAGVALPSGRYRVDVYLDGRLAGIAATVVDGADDHQRVFWHDVGLRLAVPGWEQNGRYPGQGIEFQDPTDASRKAVAVRFEGWPDLTADRDTMGFVLDAATEAFFPEADLGLTTGHEFGQFLDHADSLTRVYPNGDLWAGMIFAPYCADPEGLGTLIAVWVAGPGDAWKQPIIDSIALNDPLFGSSFGSISC